jgi:protein-S-isoprenylcysteine O-methyltransferase Ste14
MNTLTVMLKSRWTHIFSGIILGLIFSFFAYAHLLGFLKTQQWSLLFFCFTEALIVTFYIFRSKPKTISVFPLDWIAAMGGTFVPLLFRPVLSGIQLWTEIIIIFAVGFQIASILSLNCSFGIVAAKRKIKTAWMYRYVRHPLYASYCVVFIGYVLSNNSYSNLVVYLVSMGFIFMRIVSEEKHLVLDPFYQNYMLQTPYRLIPFIF